MEVEEVLEYKWYAPAMSLDVLFSFWSGSAVLHYAKEEVSANLSVYLDDQHDLILEMEDTLGLKSFELMDGVNAKFVIPELNLTIEAYLVSNGDDSSNAPKLWFHARRSPVWVENAQPIMCGQANLINLAPFRLTGHSLAGALFSDPTWEWRLIQIGDKTFQMNPSLSNDQYRVTHQLQLKKVNGAPFSVEEFKTKLFDIVLYLSFCNGNWVNTAFAVGFDENRVAIAQEWGIGRVSTWEGAEGPFDTLSPSKMVDLHAAFQAKLLDPEWKDLFRHVVYWAMQGNKTGPDAGCVLLQASLERFAWQVLVRTEKAVSEEGFVNLAAHDQLRLLLNSLRIPKDVPDSLSSIQKFAKGRGLDGPATFTQIRNRLVHPPKKRMNDEAPSYFEAFRLGMWYLMLAVLSVCGYNGEYSNCTVITRWVGSTEPVPWIAS